jgi:hypothetical protein
MTKSRRFEATGATGQIIEIDLSREGLSAGRAKAQRAPSSPLAGEDTKTG